LLVGEHDGWCTAIGWAVEYGAGNIGREIGHACEAGDFYGQTDRETGSGARRAGENVWIEQRSDHHGSLHGL
jgi:hypothetical protein